MISLFFCICLAITVFFYVKILAVEKEEEDYGFYYNLIKIMHFYKRLFYFFLVADIIFGVWLVVLIVRVETGYIADEKIKMYEAWNADIETNYTYDELTGKDAVNIAILFPELEKDEDTQKIINNYITNSEKIKEAKKDKIKLSKARWQLYFDR